MISVITTSFFLVLLQLQAGDFAATLLLPEVCFLLISQDLHVSKAQAYGIWAQSKDYGNAFNGNVDNSVVDVINNKNIKIEPKYVIND